MYVRYCMYVHTMPYAGEVCFSERTLVILVTMAKDEDVCAREFVQILHTIS